MLAYDKRIHIHGSSSILASHGTCERQCTCQHLLDLHQDNKTVSAAHVTADADVAACETIANPVSLLVLSQQHRRTKCSITQYFYFVTPNYCT
jgi:hypothetical protein